MYKKIGPDEFLIGYIPRRDGADYIEGVVGPVWGDLVDLLNAEGFSMDEDFLVLFGGKMNSTGGTFTAPKFISTKGDVLRTPRDVFRARGVNNPTINQKVNMSIDPRETPELAKTLVQLQQTPIHITGIVVRRIERL